MQKNGEKMKKLKSIIPGTAVCAVIAAAATLTGGISIGGFSFELIGAPVIAILLGMILTLVFPKLASLTSLSGGIKFTSKKILQWAVVILGFSLNLSTIAQVGAKSLPVIVGTISISLIVAFIMMKIMKVDPKTACLIGVGSSICGGSAIAATAPVIEADDEDVARSISVIFLFNVLAALIFPTLGHAIGLGTEGFAVFAGTAVNDTSSVVATGYAFSEAAGDFATMVKLTRTLAIIPAVLAFAAINVHLKRKAQAAEGTAVKVSIKSIFPWFILGFLAMSALTSLGLIPAGTAAALKTISKFLMVAALAASGLNTDFKSLCRSGAKPMLHGFIISLLVVIVAIAVEFAIGIAPHGVL